SYVGHPRRLIAIQRSERNIGQAKVQRLTKFYRRLSASGDEGQRQSSAEELYGFASSHIRTRKGERSRSDGCEPNVGRGTVTVKTNPLLDDKDRRSPSLFPLPSSLFPLPASGFRLPSSLFPLPSSRFPLPLPLFTRRT